MASKSFQDRANQAKGRVSNLAQSQSVITTCKSGCQAVTPAVQIESFDWSRWYNVNPQILNQAFFQTDNQTMDFQILPSDRHLTSAKLQITVTAVSQITIAPLLLWYRWIEFYANGGGDRICQWYGDFLHWYFAMLFSPDQRTFFSREMGFDAQSMLMPQTLLAGQTRTFWLPILLPGSDEKNPFPLHLLKNYLILRLTSKNAVEAGTASNLTLNSILLWLKHKTYPADEEAHEHELYSSYNCQRKVINVYDIQQTQTVSASTAITPITLSQFGNLDLAALYACLRLGSTNTSGGLRILQSPGPNAACAVTLNNQPFDVDGNINFPFRLAQQEWALTVPNPDFMNKYPMFNHFYSDPTILFTQSAGTGIRRYTGNELFTITPDVSGTSEVQTVTLSNAANSAGNYNLAFRGDVTGSLAYNATVGTMAAALNALPSMKKSGLTAVVTGTAVATFTITFSPPGPVTDLVQIIPTSLTQSTTPEIGSTAVTTAGLEGMSNSGSSFVIDVYGIGFNEMEIDSKTGKITVTQNFHH